MPEKITRRSMLSTGAVSAGLFLGVSPGQSYAGPLKDVWGQNFMMQWSPPDYVKRDLTPGPSHIRLSCTGYRLRKDASVSLPDQVKAVRDAGYSAAEAGSASWDYDVTDSGIRELQEALREHDVQFYALHTWVNIIDPDPAKRRENQKHVARAVEAADRLGVKIYT